MEITYVNHKKITFLMTSMAVSFALTDACKLSWSLNKATRKALATLLGISLSPQEKFMKWASFSSNLKKSKSLNSSSEFVKGSFSSRKFGVTLWRLWVKLWHVRVSPSNGLLESMIGNSVMISAGKFAMTKLGGSFSVRNRTSSWGSGSGCKFGVSCDRSGVQVWVKLWQVRGASLG